MSSFKFSTRTLSRLSAMHGLDVTYSARYYRQRDNKSQRSVTLWSTPDRRKAIELWQKSLGETYGKGHIVFTVHVNVAESESSEKKVGATTGRRVTVPLDSGVSTEVPLPPSDGPPVADAHPVAPAGRRSKGTSEGLHPEKLSQPAVVGGAPGPVPVTVKVDLTKLVG